MPRRGVGLRLLSAVAVAAALLTAARSGATTPPFPNLTSVTLTSTDGQIPIPNHGSVVSVLDFVGPGTVVDVDVSVDIATTQSDSLDISLVSPSGTTITLSTDNGGGNDNVFAGTTFDDQATGTPSAPNVRNFAYTNLVPTGPIQPEEALGALAGEPATGPWALVIVDDAGINNAMLRSWSLTISTFPSVTPSARASFPGAAPMTIKTSAGVTSTATVSGVGTRLWDVTVTVDLSHPTAADVDMFLTSPSGRRIDLVTDVGGGNADLYRGTTFDDRAGTPIADTPLPPSGTAFGTVVGEGALSAFMGEDPNGTWTLTVVDDTSSYTGTLNGWSLGVRTASACGDGTLDPGEQCDDGNAMDGDGCDSNCTPTACGNGVVSPGEDCDDGNTVGGDGCPSTCRNGETSCDDCVDNDNDGLMDAADPACEPASLKLRAVAVGHGKVRMTGKVALAWPPSGTGAVVVEDGGRAVLCAVLGEIQAHGKTASARASAGSGSVSLKVTKNGHVTLVGRGVDVAAMDDPSVAIGLTVGAQRFAATAKFHGGSRGRRYP